MIGSDLKVMVLRMCHDEILSGHHSYGKTLVRIRNTALWMHYMPDVRSYVKSCYSCPKENRKTCKRYGLIREISPATKPWEIIKMDFVTGLPPAELERFNVVLVVVCHCTIKAKFLPVHR